MLIRDLPLPAVIRELVVKQSRSSAWRSTRKRHIIQHPQCAICHKTSGVQVHHKQPFHLYPELELEPTNLITLCAKHHLIFGHLGHWKSHNSEIELDAIIWGDKYANRP